MRPSTVERRTRERPRDGVLALFELFVPWKTEDSESEEQEVRRRVRILFVGVCRSCWLGVLARMSRGWPWLWRHARGCIERK